MSVFSNSKTFHRWCAAVCSDYELLLNHFLTADGLDFETFRVELGNCGTHSLHQCAVGKGKSMDDQYHRITRILIQAAKDFWLRYPMTEMLENIDNDAYMAQTVSLTRLKSMIGGFYLTFSMFQTIPDQNKSKFKLFIDSQDLFTYYYFKTCVAESDIPRFVKIQIVHLMVELIAQDAFEICSESQMRGIAPYFRHFHNIMDSNQSRMLYSVKDSQNNCILTTRTKTILNGIQDVETLQGKINGKVSVMAIQQLSNLDGDLQHLETVPLAINSRQEDSDALATTETNVPNSADSSSKSSSASALEILNAEVEDNAFPHLLNVSGICASLRDNPVLSVPNFLANVIADRAMMSECRKRAERSTKNRDTGLDQDRTGTVNLNSGATRVRKTQPYVEEGGIFGRKNVSSGKKTPREGPSEPAECAKDVWDYIYTGLFGGGRIPPPTGEENNDGSGSCSAAPTIVQSSTITSTDGGNETVTETVVFFPNQDYREDVRANY